MVLNDWKHGQVKDFFILQRGFDLTHKQSREGTIPVYSSSGVSYYHSEYKVKGPGIVTGRKGSVGPVYFVEEDFWPHDTTLWVKDFKGNNIKYVKYFLDYLRLERFDEASSVPTLNRNNVHGFKCVFPPNLEQNKIAQILSTWDKAIEKLGALITAKQKRKKALMQQLLTGKKQFVGFEGEWEEANLGRFFVENKEKSSRNNQYPVVTSSRLGIFLQENYFKKQVASSDNTGYKIVNYGDFTFRSMSDDGVFVFNRQNILPKGIISPAYGVFTVKTGCSNYFYYFLNSEVMSYEIRRLSQGGTRTALKYSGLEKLVIRIPSIEEQHKIAFVLSAADKEIEIHKKQLDALIEQKKGLMQQLLTGKKRVKIDVTEHLNEAVEA